MVYWVLIVLSCQTIQGPCERIPIKRFSTYEECDKFLKGAERFGIIAGCFARRQGE